MFEIVRAGGWLMLPIVLCSIAAGAIIIERLWTLRSKRVLPADLAAKVWYWVEKEQLDERHIHALRDSSPLGRILASSFLATVDGCVVAVPLLSDRFVQGWLFSRPSCRFPPSPVAQNRN